MATLYAEADFSYPVGRRLRQFGHDILTAPEAAQACGELSAKILTTWEALLRSGRRVLYAIHACLSR